MMLKSILKSAKEYIRKRRSKFFGKSPSEVFSQIYHTNHWQNSETISGPGSTLSATQSFRNGLAQFLENSQITSILDIPCGDFHWMKEMDLKGIDYTGGDIVDELVEKNSRLYGGATISFQTLNLISDNLPSAQVILCRDGFVHLSNAQIAAAIENILESNIKFLICTHFSDIKENKDISTGDWRPINLCLPPFNFPLPQHIIDEDLPENPFGRKGGAIWETDVLRSVQ